MAYYLTIKKNNKIIPIDISRLSEFSKKSNYVNGGFSLEEIDSCTMMFNNEYFFKETLYNKGLIELDDINKELSIRNKRKDSLNRVRYGIAYRDSFKYFDIYRLKYILLSRQNDKVFLEKLLSYYRNSYTNNLNISKIRYAINTNNKELLNKALEEFYIREVSKIDKTTGELKLNYKPLHDLAMFIYNYEKTKSKEENGITKEEDILERKLTLEYLRNCLSGRNNEVKTKTRTKSKEIEGQINLF